MTIREPSASGAARIDPEDLRVPHSDAIAGYVEDWAPDGERTGTLTVRTSDGRLLPVVIGPNTSARMVRNLGEPYIDATPHLPSVLQPGRYVHTHGVCYPDPSGTHFEVSSVVLVGRTPTEFRYEDPGWWPDQLDGIASFYRRAQFGSGAIDYGEYRTELRLGGHKTDSHVQETDTISRLVYGMSSAYMLTGNQDYLDAADRGSEYLRAHMRFVDNDENVVYWYHGIRVDGGSEKKLFTSEFDDDYDAIPMYEQIYALAGLTQNFRVTGDRRIHEDIEGTLRLFERFFRDHEGGGYYSHIDPIELSPDHPSLGVNRARKNWNSIGDHAPAYLINLYLATGEERHVEMLGRTFDTIVERFPDDEHSPFVNERFHADWSHDLTHTWQQDRAVVGHNLKIAWNLMRMHSLRPRPEYRALAEKIGRAMPRWGSDQRRGGWYDVVERRRVEGELWHRFAWHDRKAWWQQEQAILAYLLLHGTTRDVEFQKHAREAQSFYNAFFLDHDEGAVYFNVLANGAPYLLDTERLKGSHSMSMYHSAELCYLATTYTNLLVTGEPMDLWFRPLPDADRTLRVCPDLLPPGSVRLVDVEIDGKAHESFDPRAMSVELPESAEPITVRARIEPTRGDQRA